MSSAEKTVCLEQRGEAFAVEPGSGGGALLRASALERCAQREILPDVEQAFPIAEGVIVANRAGKAWRVLLP